MAQPDTIDPPGLLTRLRILAGQVADWLTVIAMSGMAFVLADRVLPPQALPWKPLRPEQSVGRPIRPRVENPAQDPAICRGILTQGGVSFQDVPDRTDGNFCALNGAMVVTGGVVTLKPVGAVMACEEALAYAMWERQVVQPAAMELLGSPVVGIDHYGAYVCRTRYGMAGQPPSEHATGNAVDIGAFHLQDGRVISVEKAWSSPGADGQFVHRVRDGACKVFNGVLSPDYNAAHHNHLHLDMGQWAMCR